MFNLKCPLVKSNIKVLVILLSMVVAGTATMSFVSLNYDTLQLSTVTWLFIQSLSLYIAYLCFQSIFFDRFIACFKIKGNVGFFIVTIDFIGYTGTVLVLMFKEFFNTDINWLDFYNQMSGYVGIICTVAFSCSIVYLWRNSYSGIYNAVLLFCIEISNSGKLSCWSSSVSNRCGECICNIKT